MHESVKEYYGKTLAGSDDLKTDACCTLDDTPAFLRPILAKIHPEVSGRYYGCGLVLPEAIAGLHVLDLGSGAGRDVFALAALVGESGSVTGVDMTPEQLAVAREYEQYHAETFGYREPNTTFHQGYIERLDELALADNSFDLIVSNCVLNLCPDKAAVLREAHRLLKPGGEMYFSDVYADRRIPGELLADPVLHGECLSGALYWNDFLSVAKTAGFADPRLVNDRPLGIENAEVQGKVGDITFYSATWRLFKLDDLEPATEDYGQAVVYLGTVEQHGDALELDKVHRFPIGERVPVDSNTFRMLGESRFAKHFSFEGDTQTHRGVFQQGDSGMPFDKSEAKPSGGCC
ncbi:MAG: methyltransferase domain-containing protein [Pseudomonadota bacterium]